MASSLLPLTETLSPADESAVAAAVRDAAAKRMPVYPVGGGTSLDYGGPPTGPGIGLQTCRLQRVLDYPAADMTITVESGLTIAQLQSQLAAQRQWLPIDVPHAESATIGGVVAVCPSGPRRYACGTIRDYVIGVRAVDGRGEVYSGGGRVVKNAAGYNMNRLLAGSLGTLGVITQVTLMVRPLPETSAWVCCDVPDLATAERLLAGLVRTRTLPTAIELLVGQAFQPGADTLQSAPGNVTLESLTYGGLARLLVAFEGSVTEVRWMADQLADEWHAADAGQAATFVGPDADKLWTALTNLPAEIQVNVLPSDTVSVIGKLRDLVPGCFIQAHAGNGVLRVKVPPSELAGAADQSQRQRWSDLGRAIVAVGGAVMAISGRAEPVLAHAFGPAREAQAVKRAIKHRFDPEGILNPGRLAFG